jgi:multiple sugar transport system permease protein
VVAARRCTIRAALTAARPLAITTACGGSGGNGGGHGPLTVLMAGSVILTLPIVVPFFASERLLTGGLTAGAEEG